MIRLDQNRSRQMARRMCRVHASRQSESVHSLSLTVSFSVSQVAGAFYRAPTSPGLSVSCHPTCPSGAPRPLVVSTSWLPRTSNMAPPATRVLSECPRATPSSACSEWTLSPLPQTPVLSPFPWPPSELASLSYVHGRISTLSSASLVKGQDCISRPPLRPGHSQGASVVLLSENFQSFRG